MIESKLNVWIVVLKLFCSLATATIADDQIPSLPPTPPTATTARSLQTVDVEIASLPPGRRTNMVNRPGQDLTNLDDDDDEQIATMLTAKQGWRYMIDYKRT